METQYGFFFFFRGFSRRFLRKLPEQLKTDAEMAPEIKVIQHVDDIVKAVFIPPSEMIQDADFNQGLVMEPLLVPALPEGIIVKTTKKLFKCFSVMDLLIYSFIAVIC